MATIDLSDMPMRMANEVIRGYGAIHESVEIINPDAKHYIGVGLTSSITINIKGSAGYFCGGLTDGPNIKVENNVSWGVGDNMMSGTIQVGGSAGAIAGVALRGGDIVIQGNMGSRSGQVMKKGTLCCCGNSSFMAGYMMYGGRIIILGDSGHKIGENMAGGEIFVGGTVQSLGADAMETTLTKEDVDSITAFLDRYGIKFSGSFKKIVCAGKDLNYGTPEPAAKPIPYTEFSGPGTAYWNEKIIQDIQVKSNIGRYRLRGFGASRHVPHFNDIAFKNPMKTFAADAVDKVAMRTFIGDRHGARALDLSMPVMIAPMSFGAVSPSVKQALGQASAMSGISENTGEGGMYSVERAEARQLIAQCLSGRLGWNIHDMQRSDGVELYISQGAKPGLGGQLMAAKLTKEIAAMRGIPAGMDLRSPSRHPDVLGGDDLMMKIREFREAVGWRLPVSIKLGAGRTRDDVKIAYKDKLDFVELDGLQGGTGAGGNEVLEYVGIPTISAIMEAVDGLDEIDAVGKLPIVLMGGIQNGVDAAKAIALGASAVGIGTPILIAGGCIGCMQCISGKCPMGITTQDPKLVKRFDVKTKALAMHRYLESFRWQLAAVALAAGHANVHDLCRDDLVALTPEAAALTRLPYCPELRESVQPETGKSKETGTANYPRSSLKLIRSMSDDDLEQHRESVIRQAMVSRPNPFPEDRGASLDDVVFLSAALTRLVIDPYREDCSTATCITKIMGLGKPDPDQPQLTLDTPLIATGFDTAPDKVKRGLDKGLESSGAAYMGERPLGVAPWIQVITEQTTPSPEASGLVFKDFDPGLLSKARKENPSRILGLWTGTDQVVQAVDLALEKNFDFLVLDTCTAPTGLWPELKPEFDLRVMRDALSRLRQLGKEEELALISFGGLRSGTDAAKCLAYNCTATALGVSMGLSLGGVIKGDTIEFDPEMTEQQMATAVQQFIKAFTQEAAIIARCAGKTNIHNLEPEDMKTMTLPTAKALDLPMTSGPVKREGF